MNFCSNFFDTICNKKIINLDKRINESTYEKDRQNLIIFKKSLEKKKKRYRRRKIAMALLYRKTIASQMDNALDIINLEKTL